jgi:hypothetical protein
VRSMFGGVACGVFGMFGGMAVWYERKKAFSV